MDKFVEKTGAVFLLMYYMYPCSIVGCAGARLSYVGNLGDESERSWGR